MDWDAEHPLLLDSPRVWRTYLGGALLDEMHGAAPGEGAAGHFPEEWLFSTVRANNPGRPGPADPEEGLSHAVGGPALRTLIESAPARWLGTGAQSAQTGVLVKLIDAAERLAVQVHPDRAVARRLFNSLYGKTECWHILGGREAGGQTPCVYAGFRPGVTRERWKALFERQDIGGMLACLHRFEVCAGDTVLIRGGVQHAIGAGCFLAEIQELTDYTIRVERTTPSGFAVPDALCHQGIGFDAMFDCFHYDGLEKEAARAACFVTPQRLWQEAGGSVTQVVGVPDTDLFSMRELRVTGELRLPAEGRFSGLYLLEGEGEAMCGGAALPLRAPQQVFVPAACGDITLRARAPMHLLQCFGPGQDV